MSLIRSLALILLVSTVFCGLLVRYLDRIPRRHYCDFRVYYKVGQDIMKGKDIYYREEQEVTPFKYSPFFALAFSPLSRLSIEDAASVFLAVNFIFTILFFILSFNLFNCSPAPPLAGRKCLCIYALVFFCVLQYVFLVWDSGQVSIILCVLVLLGLNLSSKGQEIGAGAFLAGAILIKYMPVIFLPYLLFQKKYRTVIWTVIFAGLFLALPAFMVGMHKNIYYLSSWLPSIIGTSLDHSSYMGWKNQSVFSMIVRFFSPTMYKIQIFSWDFDLVLRAGYLVALLLYLAVLVPGRNILWGSKIDYALLFICLAIFNPNGWYINFITLGVPYMLLFCHVFISEKKDWFVIGCLAVSAVLINLIARDMVGRGMESFAGMYSFTTWGALLLFAALLKLKFLPE